EHLQSSLTNRQAVIGFDAVPAAVGLSQQRAVVEAGAPDGVAREDIAKAVNMFDLDGRAAVDIEVAVQDAILAYSADVSAEILVILLDRSASHAPDEGIAGQQELAFFQQI